MQGNKVLSHYENHQNFTEEAIQRALAKICAETGFVARSELQRRTFYDQNRTWRVRWSGNLDSKPAILRLENVALETDEESIRVEFRKQANAKVRPPITHASAPFDPTRGYAWSIDEAVGEHPLFVAGDPAELAVQAFVPFYRELRSAIQKPFWPAPTHLFKTSDVPVETRSRIFTEQQLAKWRKLAAERNPQVEVSHKELLAKLEQRILSGIARRPLQFMHAHLAGSDVRIAPDGAYVVFANHFWDWRQPGYDLAFAIWNQWMSLPLDRRTALGAKAVTDTWLKQIQANLADLVSVQDVYAMLLNRCFGSLLLDIPAKRERETEIEAFAF